jgi:Ca2+-transporting ATPase
VILTDDNFATLIHAIEEGRSILRRIQLSILYLLACNGGEILYVLLALFTGIPLLAATQLLYINLVTDGLPALVFAFVPSDDHIMRQPPVRSLSILKKRDFYYIALVGLLTAALSTIVLLPFIKGQQLTLVFSLMIFFQQFILMHLWGHRFTKLFWAAFLFPLVLHPIILYSTLAQKILRIEPLSVQNWSIVGLMSAVFLVIIWLSRKKARRV